VLSCLGCDQMECSRCKKVINEGICTYDDLCG
jgi:hypothetical protein